MKIFSGISKTRYTVLAAGLLALLALAVRPAWAVNCGAFTGCYEAEAGGETAPMQQSADNNAIDSTVAGGISGGNGNGGVPNGGGGTKSFTVTVPVNGIYKIVASVAARDTNHNSWFMQIQGVNDQNGHDWRSFSYQQTGSDTTYVAYDVIGNNGNKSDANWLAACGGQCYVRNWTLNSGTNYTVVWAAREAGSYLDYFRLVLVQALVSPTITPTVFFPTATKTPANGLIGSYYDSNNFTNQKFTRLDAPIYFDTNRDWTLLSPNDSRITDGTWSVRWTGCVQAPATGFYVFYVKAKDGVRLWVNNAKLVDQFVDVTAPTEYSNTFNVSLTANTWYPIQIEYKIDSGAAFIDLSYTCATCTPGVPRQVIPAAQFAQAGCAVPTATITPTPMPPIYQGLSPSARLYNLEYIPFPEQTDGTNYFYDLAQQFASTSATAASQPKNTARFRVVLQNLTNSAANQEVSIETRIGAVGQNCNTGFYYIPVTVPSGVINNLPAVSRPSNLSTTYFWYVSATGMDNPVPITERIDAMGDPRYTPYLDEMGYATTGLKNNYNWFFRDVDDNTKPDYHAEYSPFIPLATHWTGYGNDTVHLDVPKLFRLVREGIVQSRSIYTAMNGWNSYYVGVGGEIGGDSSNQLWDTPGSGGVPMRQEPWGGAGAGYTQEILDNKSLIKANNNSWRSLPWLGELWPDNAYASQWSSANAVYGNLNNTGNGGIYQRADWSACGDGGPASWVLLDGKSRNQGMGCTTMLNSSNGGSTFSSFNHWGVTYDAPLMYDGQMTGSQFLMPMPDLFSAQRPWDLNYITTAGNSSNESAYSPYKDAGVLLHSDVYSASNQVVANMGFYDGNDSTNQNTRRASAAVRLTDDTNKRAGWFIINGFAPTGQAGVNFVARFALLTCLRTFMDAGATGLFTGQNSYNSTVYRIEPLPYVEIIAPLSDASFNGKSTVDFEWVMSWQRWDGKPYTENYPGNVSITAQVAYNLKYSMDGGATWFIAGSDLPCSAGTYVDTAAYYTNKYTWNVAAITPGSKIFRVEAWRTSVWQHYGYHQFRLFTNP